MDLLKIFLESCERSELQLNQSAQLASKPSEISGMLYMVIAAFIFLMSMLIPFDLRLNDYETSGRLWELSYESCPFIILTVLI